MLPKISSTFNMSENISINKPGPAEVGAISKAQK